MESPEVRDLTIDSKAQPGEADRESVGLTMGASLAAEPGAAADSSTLSDIRACVQLLDRVWPREDAPPQPPSRESPTRWAGSGSSGSWDEGASGSCSWPRIPCSAGNSRSRCRAWRSCRVGDAWRRFLREAMAASRLDHPNLVPLLETGEIGAVGYIASVYVEGPSLEAWLARRQEPVPPAQAARLIATLARAIDHVHRRGILHRDLKPANVLLQDSPAGEPASLDP